MRPALAIAAALFAFQATPAAAATRWLCHLSTDLVQLVCIAEPDHEATALPVAAAAAGAAASAVTAVVNGTRFPLDRGRLWVVDLWSPPTEFEFVERLARATICYRSPGCKVEVVPLQHGRLAPR